MKVCIRPNPEGSGNWRPITLVPRIRSPASAVPRSRRAPHGLRTRPEIDDWLTPLRLVGMAFLFTAITLALTVIIEALRTQAGFLVDFYQRACRQA